MKKNPHDELIQRYSEIENRFLLRESDGKYRDLVRAYGNRQYPVQRWFHLKEGFSLNLFGTLLILSRAMFQFFLFKLWFHQKGNIQWT